jgi:hypothetical protein
VTRRACSDQINCETFFLLISTQWILFFECWTVASQLISEVPPNWRFSSSPLMADLVVYLCAKLGALNLRINEIGSQTIGLDHFLKCAPHRLSFPTILGLCNPVTKFSLYPNHNVLLCNLVTMLCNLVTRVSGSHRDHHGQHFTCLLSLKCNLTSSHQVYFNSKFESGKLH